MQCLRGGHAFTSTGTVSPGTKGFSPRMCATLSSPGSHLTWSSATGHVWASPTCGHVLSSRESAVSQVLGYEQCGLQGSSANRVSLSSPRESRDGPREGGSHQNTLFPPRTKTSRFLQ